MSDSSMLRRRGPAPGSAANEIRASVRSRSAKRSARGQTAGCKAPSGMPMIRNDLDRPRLRADRARGLGPPRIPVDQAKRDAAPRQLDRQRQPRRPRADDEHGGDRVAG